jgi:nucleotide-binding universal stress UspA family protein
MRVNRILAAIDLEHNFATLDAAFSIAEKYDAELVVLHVIDDPLVDAEKRVYPLGTDDRTQQTRVEKKLSKRVLELASKRNVSKEVKILVVRGKPGKVVRRQTINLEIDILIIGHRAEWRLEHFLFGRALGRIVDRSSCMVLVVPEPELDES